MKIIVKLKKGIVAASFMALGVFVSNISVAQSGAVTSRTISGATFSFNGKRIFPTDSVRCGATLKVDVMWDSKYVEKVVFDSACYVYQMSSLEQQQTGKKEKLVRVKTFVPYVPTSDEIKKCNYSFTVKPKRTIRYFYSSYGHDGRKTRIHYKIRVVDGNGKEMNK